MNDYDQKGQTVGTQYNAEYIIKNGVPFEQYKADLEKKEIEYRELLISATISEQEKETLLKQVENIEQKLQNEQESYQAHVNDLQERISRLDRLKGQLPEKLINEAKQALAVGDKSKAEQLFTQVEEQADPHITAAAEAAYQRGKLAEDAIHYSEAMKHYQRVTQLTPDNTDYLNAAGIMLDTLGESAKAIDYYEQALSVFLQVLGKQHPNSQVVQGNLDAAQAQLKNHQQP